jgi:hypothetical protein
MAEVSTARPCSAGTRVQLPGDAKAACPLAEPRAEGYSASRMGLRRTLAGLGVQRVGTWGFLYRY